MVRVYIKLSVEVEIRQHMSSEGRHIEHGSNGLVGCMATHIAVACLVAI